MDSVLVFVPSRGTVSVEWAFNLRGIWLPNGSETWYMCGHSIEHARNEAVNILLGTRHQWLFFLDDDVLVPEDIVKRLLYRNVEIVSALYYRRAAPIEPVLYRAVNGSIRPLENGTPLKGLMEVDYVGCGCLLVHRRVFEKVLYPWFEYKIGRRDLPEREQISEDFDFCRKARAAGFKVFVDADIHCHHLGMGKASPGAGFVPINVEVRGI
jgi:GT2 family glycosyltransferase